MCNGKDGTGYRGGRKRLTEGSAKAEQYRAASDAFQGCAPVTVGRENISGCI